MDSAPLRFKLVKIENGHFGISLAAGKSRISTTLD